MLVGLFALISMLLFGGSTESYYLVEDIDKASKIYVTDKSRKKDIQSKLKAARKEADFYFKERGKNIKKIKSLIISPETPKDDLAAFYEKQIESIENHQKLVFETRLAVLKSIEPKEWSKIVEYSIARVEKNKQKYQKKLDKKGNPWEDLQAIVDKTVSDKRNHTAVSQELELLKREFIKVEEEINDRNVQDSKIIQDYQSDLKALSSIGSDMNELRSKAFNSLVLFRAQIKNRTTDEQFVKIMKAVYSTIS